MFVLFMAHMVCIVLRVIMQENLKWCDTVERILISSLA